MARATSKPHDYTAEEKSFLCANYSTLTQKQLTAEFNRRFGHDFMPGRIASRLKEWGVLSGRDMTLKKGHVPHNKGQKGVIYKGVEKTWFKTGHKPKTWRPVGDERIDDEGYVLIKVAEPHLWRFKHRVVWEREHGPIPDNFVLIFLDGDRRHVALDNLMLLPRGVLAIANKERRVMTLPTELRAVYWRALALQYQAGKKSREVMA